MKKILPVLFSLFLIVACASVAPAIPTETAAGTDTPVSVEEPIEGETAVPSPEADFTSTPEPSIIRWYWAIENDTNKIIAFNQDGETREAGSVPASESVNFRVFTVDGERAILFTDAQSQIRAYLLTLDGMRAIQLPPLTLNDDAARNSWAVPAVYGDTLVFTYVTEQSIGTPTNGMAERGPLVLIDSQALTAKVVDRYMNRDAFTFSFYETRLWAHLSDDGRYLRYLDGNMVLGGELGNLSLREVDLATGEARTVYTTKEGHHTSSARPSLQGDLWVFLNDGILMDLNGNQTELMDVRVSPMKDGRALYFNSDCDDDCEIKVVSPFSGEAELTYTLPWAARTFHNPLVNILTEDNSLLFSGMSLDLLSNPPAIVNEYPSFPEFDHPMFRLTPNGDARLIGFYQGIATASDSVPASTDGRYMLLQSVDLASYFIYDTQEDRAVVEIPTDPTLEYFGGDVTFFDHGFLARVNAANADGDYRDHFLMHSFLTGESIAWVKLGSELLENCVDILPDNTLICTAFSADGMTSNVVRFNPENDEKTILLENAILSW